MLEFLEYDINRIKKWINYILNHSFDIKKKIFILTKPC